MSASHKTPEGVGNLPPVVEDREDVWVVEDAWIQTMTSYSPVIDYDMARSIATRAQAAPALSLASPSKDEVRHHVREFFEERLPSEIMELFGDELHPEMEEYFEEELPHDILESVRGAAPRDDTSTEYLGGLRNRIYNALGVETPESLRNDLVYSALDIEDPESFREEIYDALERGLDPDGDLKGPLSYSTDF